MANKGDKTHIVDDSALNKDNVGADMDHYEPYDTSTTEGGVDINYNACENKDVHVGEKVVEEINRAVNENAVDKGRDKDTIAVGRGEDAGDEGRIEDGHNARKGVIYDEDNGFLFDIEVMSDLSDDEVEAAKDNIINILRKRNTFKRGRENERENEIEENEDQDKDDEIDVELINR